MSFMSFLCFYIKKFTENLTENCLQMNRSQDVLGYSANAWYEIDVCKNSFVTFFNSSVGDNLLIFGIFAFTIVAIVFLYRHIIEK